MCCTYISHDSVFVCTLYKKATRRIGNPYANVRKGPQSLVNLYRFDILFYVSMCIFLLLFLVSVFRYSRKIDKREEAVYS